MLITAYRTKIIGALFLVSGAALVAHLLIGLPLNLTFVSGLVFLVGGFLAAGETELGQWLRPLVRSGLIAGAIATISYDLSRLALVKVTDSSLHPFETWRLFGIALLGESAPTTTHWVAGTMFHITNGLFFAITYTIWFGNRGSRWGIGYALVLEAFMFGSLSRMATSRGLR